MIRFMKVVAAIMLMTAMIIATGCNPEDEPNNGGGNNGGGNPPTVTTISVTDITTNSAKCGGTVTNEGDGSVTERGICWGISQMPTISGDHVNCGSGAGTFEGEMLNLLENTNYYVRAYATNSVGTSYGEEISFQTEETTHIYTIEVLANPSDYGEVIGGGAYEQGQQCTVTANVHDGYSFINWTENGSQVSSEQSYTFTVTGDRSLIANFDHEYVDLGLPSGILWATCNVGADLPENHGDHFSWGETEPKSAYPWQNYKYSNSDYEHRQLTKYCSKSYYGYNGFTDHLTILEPDDDAATVNWGADWRVPTKEEWQELLDNTTAICTVQGGNNGRLFTAANGNSLFLPNACQHVGTIVYPGGNYWSSTLDLDTPCNAWYLYSTSGACEMFNAPRSYGHSIRPVRSSR